jgi:hypothetical protein
LVGREGEHERGAVDRRADGDAEGPTSHTGAVPGGSPAAVAAGASSSRRGKRRW